MNHNIYENILMTFPNINWKSLVKTKYPRIRFYFDQINMASNKKDNNNEIIAHLATTVISLISPDAQIYFGLTFFKTETKISNYFRKKLKKLKLNFLSNAIDGNIEQNIIEVDEGMNFIYYFGKLGISEVHSINKHIVCSDFMLKKGNIEIGCYLFLPQSKILINLYDDRGMDIISINSDILNDLYNKWNNVLPIEIYE